MVSKVVIGVSVLVVLGVVAVVLVLVLNRKNKNYDEYKGRMFVGAGNDIPDPQNRVPWRLSLEKAKNECDKRADCRAIWSDGQGNAFLFKCKPFQAGEPDNGCWVDRNASGTVAVKKK